MSGEVEADETFIGGLAKNMHRHVRERKIKGTGGSGKEAVLGIIERGGEQESSRIKTAHVPNVRRKTLGPETCVAVEPGSRVYTDALKSYLDLSDVYTPRFVGIVEFEGAAAIAAQQVVTASCGVRSVNNATVKSRNG